MCDPSCQNLLMSHHLAILLRWPPGLACGKFPSWVPAYWNSSAVPPIFSLYTLAKSGGSLRRMILSFLCSHFSQATAPTCFGPTLVKQLPKMPGCSPRGMLGVGVSQHAQDCRIFSHLPIPFPFQPHTTLFFYNSFSLWHFYGFRLYFYGFMFLFLELVMGVVCRQFCS